MSREVAQLRGLGKDKSQIPTSKHPSASVGDWARWTDDSIPLLPTPPLPAFGPGIRRPQHTFPHTSTRFIVLNPSSRQTVDISISHEDDYAVAVCLAPTESTEDTARGDTELEVMVDQGIGEAIHEPEWGDRGF